MPFRILIATFKILFSWHKLPPNIIQRSQELTGVKKSAFKEYIDLYQFKKYAKSQNCTVNEYATALMSTALYKYFT
jgi:hypothetical protein